MENGKTLEEVRRIFEGDRFATENGAVIEEIGDHSAVFTPTNADGKRISRNIYAQTREECEEKLAVLIVEMKAEIAQEKAKLKEGAD